MFNEAGDLTGGLLYAAKKFGLKLDANEVGAMIKLNPINRLRPIELGRRSGAGEKFDQTAKIAKMALKNGTTLKEETLKTKLINEKDFDRIVDPKKMIYPE